MVTALDLSLVLLVLVNQPIDIAGLPQLDDGDFVGVSPDYLKMAAIPFRIIQLIVVFATVVAAILLSPWLILAGLVLVAQVQLVPVFRRLAYPYLGYLAREHDFSVRYGLINRTVTTIPFKRIQNSVVNQGPLERRFGLSTLRISSAGGSLSIPGMPFEDASRLRAFVAMNASLLVEDDADGA